jgi:hypothetical protein
MDRSLFSSFGSSLLGITATLGFVTLGFLWSSPEPTPPLPQPSGDWHLLEPITYENLTVFPVVTSAERDTSMFLTLEEGLSSGEITVREQGAETLVRNRGNGRAVPPNYSGPSVNQLVLVNHGKRPLLLLAGELVSGGKQDRIIAKDRIVPPFGEPLPLDVFCVEHGRWSSGSQFNEAKTIVHPSVREQAALKQNQTQVWDAVALGSTSAAPSTAPQTAAPRVSRSDLEATMHEEAPTQSYSKIYESRRVGSSVDVVVSEIQRRFRRETSGLKGERVVGVVIAYGGEVAWSDIFASGELFDNYWNKLLRSYAVEAIARPTLREKVSVNDALEFLRRLNGRETAETEPGVYVWREINDGVLSQIELEALQPKSITLHRLVVRRTS